ncbi:MAG: class I SAM-dependent methyltransferase [Aristaeellaceae bacterium]
MTSTELRQAWLQEEAIAHMKGWDFSHLHGRYTEEEDLPWDYEAIVRSHLSPEKTLLDMGTGGGEFLLTLGHPPAMTTATEGYPPNAELCRERLTPLGIRVVEADGEDPLPLPDNAFDLVINRHESYSIPELRRILKPGGLFITQQVGEDNDRDLAELLLPGTGKPFPGLNAAEQARRFREAGFTVLRQEEAFRPIRFFDVGALVWFARVIPWEFPGFSVEACFDRLLEAQRILNEKGEIRGMTHRFLLVARK